MSYRNLFSPELAMSSSPSARMRLVPIAIECENEVVRGFNDSEYRNPDLAKGAFVNTIRAVYENGVFRPTEPVLLPDRTEVDFEFRTVHPPVADQVEALRDADPGLAAIYEVLSRRHESGHHDTVERHNDHQP